MTAATWDGYPSYQSQQFFLDSMEGHSKVQRVSKVSPSRWDLELANGRTLKVFVTDVYTFSLADYSQLRSRYSGVGLIVSASKWNHFSTEMGKEASQDNVATAMLGAELMSMVHELAKS